ncbi:hypothetical protein Tco_0184796 [Tanacetum coccineum]
MIISEAMRVSMCMLLTLARLLSVREVCRVDHSDLEESTCSSLTASQYAVKSSALPQIKDVIEEDNYKLVCLEDVFFSNSQLVIPLTLDRSLNKYSTLAAGRIGHQSLGVVAPASSFISDGANLYGARATGAAPGNSENCPRLSRSLPLWTYFVLGGRVIFAKIRDILLLNTLEL